MEEQHSGNRIEQKTLKVTVYCGAATGKDPKYADWADRLGKWIADSRGELVFGAGGVGLMGIVAKSVLKHGGSAHGIIPQALAERERPYEGLTTVEVVHDMDERKRRMMELGDVYIAFPGGPGTVEEITEAFSWARIGLTSKPCVFFNLDGYWDPIRTMYQRMVDNGFLNQGSFDKLLFANSFDEIIPWARQYVPPTVRTYTRTQ
ncbi:TIGR00730 family Rossman fold protein [Bifidobacterium aquikefiri]|uniref:LOG family protein n=1 Tax=Bifidobacterium aquikefiri TaxID=1653207 RepID=UPI0023F39389|nr:TIGR00730 family Rossman fold protein [Bifidobacterium aquikefiri]